MDNEEALRLCREGGTFLCLGVPAGSEFGIDQQTWITAANFQGIKMIPAGFHYIRWRNSQKQPSAAISGEDAHRVSVVGERNSFLPLMGCFCFVEPSQISILRWCSEIEDLVPLTEEESESFALGVQRMEFDSTLGAFPLGDSYTNWKALTNFISRKTIQRCAPRDNRIRQLKFFADQNTKRNLLEQEWSESVSKAEKNEDGTPCEHTKTAYMEDYNFKAIPQRWIPSGESSCTGADRTKYFMDKSYLLNHLIETRYGAWQELLGELQFSFISFWLAESYESFEHWKQMIILVCNCELSIFEKPEQWKILLKTIESQMQIVPEDFFVDILSGKNFLEPSLKNLFLLLKSLPSDSPLQFDFISLKQTVEQRFQISFDVTFDSDDEDAPVIVEL